MQRIIHLFTALLLFTGISQHIYAFNPKEGYKEGILVLKSGVTLQGKILPLVNYNESGTGFKNEQGVVSIISHNQIARMNYGSQVLVPKTIQFHGKSIPAYTELMEDGSAALWKTYFYYEKALGKNTSATQFHTGWLIESPTSGSIALDARPSSKQVSAALHHPMIALEIHDKHLLDEWELKNVVTSFNSSMTQLESHKNDNSK